jgi:hypothetical protein
MGVPVQRVGSMLTRFSTGTPTVSKLDRALQSQRHAGVTAKPCFARTTGIYRPPSGVRPSGSDTASRRTSGVRPGGSDTRPHATESAPILKRVARLRGHDVWGGKRRRATATSISSWPRRRPSTQAAQRSTSPRAHPPRNVSWIPASAGMTGWVVAHDTPTLSKHQSCYVRQGGKFARVSRETHNSERRTHPSCSAPVEYILAADSALFAQSAPKVIVPLRR